MANDPTSEEAYRAQLAALSQLILSMEGANRELLGTVRTVLEEQRAARQIEATARHAPSPLATASADALRAVVGNTDAQKYIGIALALLLICLSFYLIAGLSADADHVGGAMIQLLAQYLGVSHAVPAPSP